MTPALFIDTALTPALRLLPARMDTPAARAMVLAICFQESRLKYRQQIGGPARGYAQFEVGGIAGVLTHRASRPHIEAVLAAFDLIPAASLCHAAVEFNDILACVFARLLLWTDPGRLPGRAEPEVGWNLYLRTWRPGAYLKAWRPGDAFPPMPARFAEHFRDAWALVDGAA